MKKIIIGLPCLDMMHSDTAISVAASCLQLKHHNPDFLIGLLTARGPYIQVSRNQIVKHAIMNEADYLFMVDSDMNFPEDTFTRLMAHDKDVVGVVYHSKRWPHDMVGVPDNSTYMMGPTAYLSGLTKMKIIGMGVTLFKMSVFHQVPYPWFDCPRDPGADQPYGEDVYFCNKARTHEIDIWADIDLSEFIGHCSTIPVTNQMAMHLQKIENSGTLKTDPLVEELS
jgi:hypothetical protein